MANLYLVTILSLTFLTSTLGKPGYVLKDEAEGESEVSDEGYRLPDNIEVFEYQVNLTFPEDLFTANGDDKFSGISTVIFQLKSKTNAVKLHASKKHLEITKVTLRNINQPSWDWNETTSILSFTNARTQLVDKNLTLEIQYTGILNSGLSGVYRSSYVNSKNETKYLLSTQMEPTHARTVFPCFDEPYLKAQFYFNFTIPSNMKILFNTPQNSSGPTENNKNLWYTFDRTPRMSTYLVAFVISDFDCTKGADLDKDVPYQVCSRTDLAKTRAFAVEYGPKSLAALESFTDIKYSSNIRKMDQVAIPDFSAGAMENWGLVTYRESALLYDDDVTTNAQKQAIATVISHELAHQWFGNLVTCKWWSETFLNEGFARYLEHFITHKIYEAWQLDKQFITSKVQSALAHDSLLSTEALQSDVSTPAEIQTKFGTISYDKGASILHMVSNIMGAANFQKGIRAYLEAKNGSYSEPSDLLSALEKNIDNTISNIPDKITFSNIMENWIKLPGFPLLSVNLTGNTIKITQERFLLSGENKTPKWYVPISYTTSLSKTKFSDTNPSLWLTPENELSFAIDKNASWIILNNKVSAYYRVNYDESLWYKISSALNKTDFDGIDDLNRAQIVDDVFSLFKVGKLNYTQVFGITEFLKNDVSLYSWQSAITGINYVNKRITNSKLRTKFQTHMLNLINKLYESVPLNITKNDDQIYTLTQVLAGTWACYLGNQDCIDQSNEIFKSNKETGTKLSKDKKNLKSIVYCNAIRYSGDSENWEALWNAYLKETSASERSTILTALGCTSDVDLQKKFLQLSISADSPIRTQDALSVFSSVYTGSVEGVETAFDFFLENYEAIGTKYGSMGAANSLILGISDRLNTEEQINKLKQFVESKGDSLSDEFKQAINTAVELSTANLGWIKKYEDDIYSYYQLEKSFGSIHKPMTILILSAVLTYLLF